MTIKALTISHAAKSAGVGIETIRYYQRIGLIEEPTKPSEGYRLYPEHTISKVRFIKRAQELGFTLKEIKLLLNLGRKNCIETKQLATNKLNLVDEKIKDLQAIKATLSNLVQHCATRQDDEDCPIIFSISN